MTVEGFPPWCRQHRQFAGGRPRQVEKSGRSHSADEKIPPQVVTLRHGATQTRQLAFRSLTKQLSVADVTIFSQFSFFSFANDVTFSNYLLSLARTTSCKHVIDHRSSI